MRRKEEQTTCREGIVTELTRLKVALERCDLEYAELIGYEMNLNSRTAELTFDVPYDDWWLRKWWNRWRALIRTSLRPLSRSVMIRLEDVSIFQDKLFLKYGYSTQSDHLEIEAISIEVLAPEQVKLKSIIEGNPLELVGRVRDWKEINTDPNSLG